MAAEHVAGEQKAFLLQPGALGVGPVQVGGVQEAQGAMALAMSSLFSRPFNIIWALKEMYSRAWGARRMSSGRAPVWSGSRWLRTMAVISS
jgi:hypothetical protein